jgi:hypothetical protein
MKSLLCLVLLSLISPAVLADDGTPENPGLLSYLKSVDATSSAPEKGVAVAKDWDKAILSQPVISGYVCSKAAAQPANAYDCIVSEYVTDTATIVTKQTPSVWFAQVTPAHGACDLAEMASRILASTSAAAFSPVSDGTDIARALIGSDSPVLRMESGEGRTETPGWRESLRIVQDCKTTYMWALKQTGRPMAAVIGYDDDLNRSWFARFR